MIFDKFCIKFTLDDGASKPEKAHEFDAGFDLCSMEDITLVANAYGGDGVVIDTGVHVEIPKGYVGYVQGRSGLNVKKGVICPTGTIDCGYTGSIRVKLYNLSHSDYNIHKGDKIAQLVIQPMAICEPVEVESLSETERGDNGFGSTGL